MPILELCAGYGGLGMAVEALTDDRVAYVAEVDEAACKILAHRMPDVPNIGDITTYDWAQLVGKVTKVVAGWPCQDISNAGPREGIDGDRSGIYRNVIEAIRVLRPRLVFLENVSAIRSRGLWQVVADLAAIGYDVRWTCLRASDVGAAHHRDRWFAIAYPADADGPRLEVGSVEPARDEQPASVGGGARPEDPDGTTWVGRDGGSGDEPAPEGRGEPSNRCYSPAEWWGDYLPAIRRQEHLSGRPAPAPTETGPRGGRRLTARFAEWLMWLPDGWVTAVPGLATRGRDPRAKQLKAIGNGVVPAQAYEAYRYLLTLDTHTREN
ncbi:DNA cytosine methyltransferase [Streptomyces sp. NTK 937]|uniref:DNA cytosine methyltransferase n=1 Tax=Streptomyces sp. NTK 937 TaxID=1487711 RepID=UPI0004A90A73|nr:DNA cytosine methyltransferase [Streptomyces sp. NTK 937]KDQ65727.1 hypothetical protein DT87_00275 [Streptomyces sp. NTK 937]